MRAYGAKDVDAYITSASSNAQPTMHELRKLIRATVPDATEGISWGVPFYKHNGLLAGFAAFKNHVSFGLAFMLQESDRASLEKKGYTTGSKTIQIRFDQKIPAAAIKRILKEKAAVNTAQKRIARKKRVTKDAGGQPI